MSDEENISKFIADCASKGIDTPDAILQVAVGRIQEIDNILLEADRLRPKRTLMEKIVRSFGGSVAPKRRRKIPILAEEASHEELDEVSQRHAISICRFLSENGPATNRQLMSACGVTPDNDVEIVVVIKWMCAQGLLAKNSDRALIKGPNWDNRPTEN